MKTRMLISLWHSLGPDRPKLLRGLIFRLLQSFSLGSVFALMIFTLPRLISGVPVDTGLLMWISLGCAVGLILQLVFSYLALRDIWLSAYRASGSLRHRVMTHLRALPLAYHRAHPMGDRMAAVSDDAKAIEAILSEGLPTLLQAVILPFSIFLWFVFLDPFIVLCASFSIPLAAPILWWANKRMATLAVIRQDLQANAGDVMVEFVLGLPIIRACNAPQEGLARFDAAIQKFRDISVRMVAALTLPMTAFGAVVVMGVPATLLAMGLTGTPESGDRLVAPLLLMFSLYLPVLSLLSVMEMFRLADASLNRIARILSEPLPSPHGVQRLPDSWQVTLSGVSFAYPDASPVLKDLYLSFPEGKMTALTGPSGAGKSTLAALIAGQLQPDCGQIRIGGVELAEFAGPDLADHVMFVPQNTRLFEGTIASNIAKGRPGASMAQIENAARLAQADPFIQALPDGYDTYVGEAGLTLSGGEHQRLAIARALIGTARLLILDEATSALDATTEHQVLSRLKSDPSGRTVLLITHRSSAADMADSTLELERAQAH